MDDYMEYKCNSFIPEMCKHSSFKFKYKYKYLVFTASTYVHMYTASAYALIMYLFYIGNCILDYYQVCNCRCKISLKDNE